MTKPSQPGITLDGVWKKFRRGEMHDSLRDLVPAAFGRLRRRGRRPDQEPLKSAEFWALRDLSFSVGPGEALGIIGGNGAGKSTTLKVINGILRPNLGTCRVVGRMGALIEIAAGFHQDLTGRENVYLQGLIMGMSKAAIRERFDDIVDFAGMGAFIDTPVKRYSSGMNARLGFAIAAHLDPDVLIIDEVLAVGDFRFQQRAFDRVKDLVRSGMPVIVVSHQLDRIATLCTKALLLQRGEVVSSGSPTECITRYLAGEPVGKPSGATADADGTPEPLHFVDVSLASEAERDVGEDMALRLVMRANPGFDPSRHSIGVRLVAAHDGRAVGAATTARMGVHLPERGEFTLMVQLSLNVSPGIYAVESYVWDLGGERQLCSAPVLYVQVRDDVTFVGTTYLRPRISVVPSLVRANVG